MGTTLSFRIGLVMLAGFILLQLLLLIILQLPGRAIENATYGLPSPPALAQMVTAMEQAGPAGADSLASSYDGSLFTVRIERAAPRDYREVPPALAGLARAYRHAVADHNMVVDGGPGFAGVLMGDRARPWRFLVPIRLTIWLRDGRVLLLTGRPASGLRAYLARRSLLGFVGGALLLILLWLALRQTTRPLRRLTQAVHMLGQDLHAADVRAEGSRETRELALAFNGMKQRIAGLVEERTFILAGIAHDMRTYLTRLRLRMEFIVDPDQHRRAEQDLDQMSALLDDNLLFAGIDRGPPEPMQRIELAALTRDLVDARIDADRIGVAPALPAMVEADPAGLERIFGNLVDNGLRHATHLDIAILREGDRVLWRFEDDGPGVPPEELSRLGQAYHRLEPSRNRMTGGAGLGLAIVRALAETMKGELTFDLPAGGGLRITVAFPAAPD